MKTTVKKITMLTLALAFVVCLAACNAAPKTDIWDSAVYSEDTELGTGSKTVMVEVEALQTIVTFTVHTDKDTVGAVLLEHGLIAGEEGPYGMYIKSVNGMTADYDVDQYYWAFYVNGEYGTSGVDMTDIDESAVYRLAYTK